MDLSLKVWCKIPSFSYKIEIIFISASNKFVYDSVKCPVIAISVFMTIHIFYVSNSILIMPCVNTTNPRFLVVLWCRNVCSSPPTR